MLWAVGGLSERDLSLWKSLVGEVQARLTEGDLLNSLGTGILAVIFDVQEHRRSFAANNNERLDWL